MSNLAKIVAANRPPQAPCPLVVEQIEAAAVGNLIDGAEYREMSPRWPAPNADKQGKR